MKPIILETQAPRSTSARRHWGETQLGFSLELPCKTAWRISTTWPRLLGSQMCFPRRTHQRLPETSCSAAPKHKCLSTSSRLRRCVAWCLGVSPRRRCWRKMHIVHSISVSSLFRGPPIHAHLNFAKTCSQPCWEHANLAFSPLSWRRYWLKPLSLRSKPTTTFLRESSLLARSVRSATKFSNAEVMAGASWFSLISGARSMPWPGSWAKRASRSASTMGGLARGRESPLGRSDTRCHGHPDHGGREGLNLQHFKEIYFVSAGWNPSIEDQAVARCHRMGQEDTVNVFRFEMEPLSGEGMTLDRYCGWTQDKKRELFQQLEWKKEGVWNGYVLHSRLFMSMATFFLCTLATRQSRPPEQSVRWIFLVFMWSTNIYRNCSIEVSLL